MYGRKVRFSLALAIATLSTSAFSFVCTPRTHRRRICGPVKHSTAPSFATALRSSKEEFPLHVITHTELILPGETKTFLLSNPDESIPLIQECIEAKQNLAMGVQVFFMDEPSSSSATKERSRGEEWQYHEQAIAQVASLCEIIGVTEEVGHGASPAQASLDVQCVGRVKLSQMVDQYTLDHSEFEGDYVYESISFNDDSDEWQKAVRLEHSIESLVNKCSELKETLSSKESRHILYSSLKEHYADAVEVASETITKGLKLKSSRSKVAPSTQYEELKRIVATSWAAFTCLNDEKLEARYRLQALDRKDVIERLKLAQYAWREKQLLLQGQIMAQQAEEEPPLQSLTALDDLNAFQ